jgi:excinuclease ABC subunit C
LVTRDRTNPKSEFYGPFVDAGGLRAALKILQKIFKYRSCALDIRADDDKRRFVRPCINFYIDLCTGPCAAKVDKEAYRANIRRLVRVLTGQRKAIVDELRAKMKECASAREFEAAALYRDQVDALESLDRMGDLEHPIDPEVPVIDPAEGVASLQTALGLPGLPATIEGFDVAHLSGTDAVASCVTFLNGVPARGGYRRFKIKRAEGGDDFASLKEVVSRRYVRLRDEGAAMPDLIMVDGGQGQMAAAAQALRESGIPDFRLCSLAKREEIIYTLDHPEGVRLARRNTGLRLLQYVRDEAHRFAQHYHHILRRKRAFDE